MPKSSLPDSDVAGHYRALSKVYTDQYDPAQLETYPEYPANQFRLRRIIERLQEIGSVERIIDLGLGEGTPAMRVRDAIGCEVRGMDFTSEMLDAAKAQFAEKGADPEHLIWGNIEDWSSFSSLLDDGPFDAALCLGVMPHISDEPTALANIRRCLKPGGTAFVSFRNPLFNLFTANRMTHDFIVDELLEPVADKLRDAAASAFKESFRMDKPPIRLKNEKGGAGYDTILAKFHNPLTIDQPFNAVGFDEMDLHFYHYHPVPPWLEGDSVDKPAFRKAAFALEGEDSGWRGYFLCSAYTVEARAAR